jgi:hypothetical protein
MERINSNTMAELWQIPKEVSAGATNNAVKVIR